MPKCGKCGGMLKQDSFLSHERWEGFTCALCGAVHDAQGQRITRAPTVEERNHYKSYNVIHGGPARAALSDGMPSVFLPGQDPEMTCRTIKLDGRWVQQAQSFRAVGRFRKTWGTEY